jgi:hypothetical protein
MTGVWKVRNMWMMEGVGFSGEYYSAVPRAPKIGMIVFLDIGREIYA